MMVGLVKTQIRNVIDIQRPKYKMLNDGYLGIFICSFTDLNECDPSGYLMSPTLGSGKNTWSICSQRYLDKFLRYVYMDKDICLYFKFE